MNIQADVERPVPQLLDRYSRQYFEGWADGRLLVQQCPDCDHWQHYPRALCEICGGTPEFREQEPDGTVYTYTVIRQMGVEPFRSEVPFPVVMVEIACGVKIMGTLTDCDVDDVHIGMPVEGYAITIDGIAIPYWRPRTSTLAAPTVEEGA
jgi:uncharacterized OB-fold protein